MYKALTAFALAATASSMSVVSPAPHSLSEVETEIEAPESNDLIVDLALQIADIENQRLRDEMINLVVSYDRVIARYRNPTAHHIRYRDGLVEACNVLFRDDIPDVC